MKTVVLASLALMASSPVGMLAAQTTVALRAGTSIATIGGSDAGNPDSRTGLNVAGAVTFGVSPALGIQIGAGYVQKGFTGSVEGTDVKFSLDYIEVPLLLRVVVPTTSAISPHFVVGPVVGAKAKCEVSVSGGGASVTLECGASDIPVKAIDIGAMAGAGLNIATSGRLSFTLDAAYNLGLVSIDDSSDGTDLKNRAWSIVGGIEIPIR